MDFVVKAKTPIYTGDANKESRIIRETGIIGGLRWWYEALMRGKDRSICDPTIDKNCECDACKLFGNTCGARMFNLRFDDLDAQYLLYDDKEDQIKVGIGGGSGWYLPAGKIGKFNLSINGLRGHGHLLKSRIPVLLKLIENWGAIGSKNYIGYGVFESSDEKEGIIDIKKEDVDELLEAVPGSDDKNAKNVREPSLKNMFFCKVNLDFSKMPGLTDINVPGINNNIIQECIKNDFLPTSAHIRYQLRSAFRGIYRGTNTGKIINISSKERDIIAEIAPTNGEKHISGSIQKGSQFSNDCFVSYSEYNGQATHINPIDFCSEDPPCPYCSSDSKPPGTLRELLLPSLRGKRDVNMLRHRTIGEIGKKGEDNEGSKIAASHLYILKKEKSIWQMRIWGYIPNVSDSLSTSIILDLKERFEDEKFWMHCLDNKLLTLNAIDFRHMSCFPGDYGAFVKDLIFHREGPLQ